MALVRVTNLLIGVVLGVTAMAAAQVPPFPLEIH